MSKHVVTGVKIHDFADENGQRVQGVKVYYLDNVANDSSDAKGYFPLNSYLSGDHAHKFPATPGIYDIEFKFDSDKFGKPVVRLRDIQFIEAVELPSC